MSSAGIKKSRQRAAAPVVSRAAGYLAEAPGREAGGESSAAPRRESVPAKGLDGGHRHFCTIYENSDDLLRHCAALTRPRELGGMRWLGLFDSAAHRDKLAPLCREAGRPGTISSAEDLFAVRAAPVCVTTVVNKLQALCEGAVGEGFRGLLVLIDMSWMLEAPSGLANLGELEAGLHALAEKAPLKIVCLYSRELFPANVLLDALRTHPALLDAGEARRNPYFLPPPVFLSGDAAKKLDWWLGVLRESGAQPAAGPEAATVLRGDGFAAPPAAISAAKPVIAPVPATGEEPSARRRPPAQATMGPVRPNFEIDQFGEPAVQGQPLKRWKIRCLGELRIYSHDGNPVAWNRCSGATYKTKTLFAFLLQRGAKGASVEETADLLWPEASDLNQSLNRLYHTVHCLRMALSPELSSSRHSPYLVSRNRRYYLTLPEGTWVDVPVFEQFCRQGEQLLKAGEIEQSLTCHMAAERLYSGALFADIPVEYVEDPERDWCWSQRFWLEEIYLKMLACTAAIHRAMNDPKLALSYCERVLRVDPCAESAHREAMRAYHMIGRLDALERQYRLCRESLKRFEDREPARETANLARQLMG
ncbi:MAG: MEDS domain-containing protein [Rhodobiaceae bacterium]|nr:MEDS domain-containing protein [Rhodobiaceae bacterium]